MKTKTINIILLTFILLLGISSCSTENESLVSDTSAKSKLSISATDNGFSAEAGGTRATTATDFTTTFVSGDQMGMFVTDGSKVVVSNICLTYNGTKWAAANAGDAFYYDSNSMSGYQFFAYYPYTASASLTGVPAAGDATTATDADAFFSAVKTGWTVKTDQSTAANYTASDLMIGKGTIGSLANDEYPLSFTLNHAMSLVEINVPEVIYTNFILAGKTDYKFTSEAESIYSWTDFTPYEISHDKFRYIQNPATSKTFTGTQVSTSTALPSFTPSLTAGKYHQIFINKASLAASSTVATYPLAVGDLYYLDGSIAKTYISTKTPIGVVVSTNGTYCESGNGFGHGLVMALADAGTEIAWKTANNDAGLTKCSTYKALYNDFSGLTNQTTLGTSSTYPAFNAAYNYLSAAHPTGCSSWFLPSAGQWWDAMEKATTKKDGSSLTIAGYHNSDNSPSSAWVSGDYKALTALNALMGNYSGLTYTAIGDHYYWTGTEWGTSLACNLYFSSSSGLIFNSRDKTNTLYVRPFLAF